MAAMDGDEYITLCPLTIKQFPWHLEIQAAPAAAWGAPLYLAYNDASAPPSDGRFNFTVSPDL